MANPALLSLQPDLDAFIEKALDEDIKGGDHSSFACIPDHSIGSAVLYIKEDCIIAGIELAEYVFKKYAPGSEIKLYVTDGQEVQKGDRAFIIKGKIQDILKLERFVLNCMQRMSGIATQTHDLVSIIKSTKTKLLDTRKTTPTIRFLEKWAVRIGGGQNHRFGLYDMIMLKDNHIDGAGGVEQAIKAARKYIEQNAATAGELKIEIETRNMDEVKKVISIGGIDRIMLDNFSPEQAKAAVDLIAGRYETEISGGITKENILAYAQTGADYISSSQMTHSVKSIDLSLKLV